MERIKIKKENDKEMNENLSQLVQNEILEAPPSFSEDDLILPQEEIVKVADIIEDVIAEPQARTVAITTLANWFEDNCANFENINQVKVLIRGIDPEKTIIMAVKDGSGEKDSDGNDKRMLRVFQDADELPVLNLPAISMDIFNNGFRIIYSLDDNIFIKTYGLKTGLISVFCYLANDVLVPYAITRSKKKETELQIVESPNQLFLQTKMVENIDKEALQLLYKQSSKAIDKITTKLTAITWLVERQSTVTDINHHLQIDSVIIDLLK